MSPKAFYASTHRMPFSETSTQNKGLFGTPRVKGSLLSLRSIPTSKGSEVAGAGSSYMQIHMMQTSQQWTRKVPSYPFFSKQFGESLEHWTDSSVAVALKAKVDPTCLQSLVKLCRDRKLLFEEMFLAHHDHFHRRDHCSPHFIFWPWRRWPLGPSNVYGNVSICQMDTLPYTFSLERHWLYHTVNEFPSATRWWHSHSRAVIAWQFWPVTAFI